MKTQLLSAAAALVLATTCTWAQPKGKHARAGRPEPDANGDGVVDEMEATQAAQGMLERAEKMLNRFKEKYDADGDGALNEIEVQKLRNSFEENGRKVPGFLKMIDTDQNWAFSEAEKAAALKQAVQRFTQGEGKGKGKGEGKGQKGRGRVNPDTNGDCLIDAAESQAAAKARIEMVKKHMGRMKERFQGREDGRFPHMLAVVDTNQDWEISPDEEAAASAKMLVEHKARNELVLKHFDADGSGDLSASEQAAAKKATAFAEEGIRNAAKRRFKGRGRQGQEKNRKNRREGRK